jgi:16S rRNA processing protein RimM
VTDRIAVGRVGKPHGLDGSFVVENASEDGRWFRPGARLQADGRELAVVASRRARGRPVIRLEEPVSRGVELLVPVEALPPTAEDEYYTFQLVGLEVVEEGGEVLGRVQGVDRGVANDVLVLEGGLLLPLVEACVRDVDLEAGRILVAPGFSHPD